MEETWGIWPAPEPSTPPAGLGVPPGEGQNVPPPRAAADETDPFAQAGSQIAQLFRRFIEDVGALIRDAQLAADSARSAHADAERLRADAEAEAVQIIDAARAEADQIYEEAKTRAAEAERSVRGVVDDIERAHERLAEAVGRFGADTGERTASHDVVDLLDTPDEPPAQS